MSDGQSTITTTSGHPCRLLVAGRARSGKDTVAAMLAKASGGVLRAGLSTSEFYCRQVYRDKWRSVLEHYKATPAGRAELAYKINVYVRMGNTFPGAQLYGEMVAAGIDIIVGIRRLEEVRACVRLHLLTHAVWVGREVGRDGTLDYDEADLITTCLPLYMIDNYGELSELPAKVARCWEAIKT